MAEMLGLQTSHKTIKITATPPGAALLNKFWAKLVLETPKPEGVPPTFGYRITSYAAPAVNIPYRPQAGSTKDRALPHPLPYRP